MKKKSLKILRVVLLVFAVLIVGAIVMVNLFADGAIKAGIEVAGTKTLGVGVSVGEVDLAIMEGKLSFEDLVIDNPPGYEHEKLLELKEGRIEVDVSSLLSDTVKISEIMLDGFEVVLEQRGISNNLQDVIKSIPRAEGKKEPAKIGKKLHIDSLEITNVTVRVKLLPVPGKVDTVTLKLDPIRMENLGSENKLDAAALTAKVLLAIATGVAKQGAGVLPDEMTDAMKSTLGITIDIGKEVIKDGTNIGKEVLKGVGDVGKGITGGLKGLLKKKKEE